LFWNNRTNNPVRPIIFICIVDYLKDNPDYKKSGERLVKIIRVAIILIIWCDYFYQTGPNIFCVMYVSDILVFLDNLEDYHTHVRLVFKAF
jgi:hypothetical protein